MNPTPEQRALVAAEIREAATVAWLEAIRSNGTQELATPTKQAIFETGFLKGVTWALKASRISDVPKLRQDGDKNDLPSGD
ncbi:MAG TPA: hypothetical protein VNN25_21895 [Thermoanaerobaculia bacterium]|nr:hypothetical protein [Thermoanaerobaculia bacterium]